MYIKKTAITAVATLAVFASMLTLTACSQTGGALSTDSDTQKSTSVTTALSTTVADSQTTAANTAITDSADADDPEKDGKSKQTGIAVRVEEVPSKNERSNGIDVSKWQGKIDWQKVKKSGIEFAFIRIGYRDEKGVIRKDANADYNLQQAEKAGILTGVYFFSTAKSKQEAAEEAAFTLRAIENYSISYPVVYDCEGYTDPASRMYGLTAAQRTENAKVFLKAVAAAGYDPMFYGALTEITDPTYWELSAIREQYKIWVAQYPDIPYPKKDKPDLTGRFDAWQYTNKGSVPGVTGDVDMVVCYFKKDKAAPKNTAKTTAASAPLTEEEKQYTAVSEKVTAKDITNLRAAASTDAKLIASLKNGETVTRIGVGTNGWSKLEYKGQIVYAVSSYLTTDLEKKTTATKQDIVANHVFTAKKDRVTAKSEVNLRALPSTDAKIVGVLKSGDFLDRTAVSDKGWSRLEYNGKTVYAVTSYLSNEVVTTTTDQENDGFTAVKEKVTAKEATNLRTAPSLENTEVVYTLKNGEYITRVGVHPSGWSKLEYKGQTVYAISSYLIVQE